MSSGVEFFNRIELEQQLNRLLINKKKVSQFYYIPAMKSSINEIGNDVLACEALDSFFFKSSSSEVVVDPYSYHSFILSQHKLSSASAGTSSVPANDSVLLVFEFSYEFRR